MHTVELYKEFRFDAAHFLPHAPDGHPNKRMHGHSFRVSVFMRGAPNAETGLLQDLQEVNEAIAKVHDLLDHNTLNEIAGLEVPTLENLSIFIFNALADALPTSRLMNADIRMKMESRNTGGRASACAPRCRWAPF